MHKQTEYSMTSNQISLSQLIPILPQEHLRQMPQILIHKIQTQISRSNNQSKPINEHMWQIENRHRHKHKKRIPIQSQHLQISNPRPLGPKPQIKYQGIHPHEHQQKSSCFGHRLSREADGRGGGAGGGRAGGVGGQAHLAEVAAHVQGYY